MPEVNQSFPKPSHEPSPTQGADDVSSAPTGAEPLLEVQDLTVTFPGRGGNAVQAVRGVNYQVAPGEFLGIVGESGSGKSVSSLAVMGLLPSSAKITGSLRFRGQDLLTLNDRQLSKLRGREMAMIFQDPLSALTPVYTIGQQIEEALTLHNRGISAASAHKRAVELLKIVGIPGAERRVRAFPHEFSGGMRQRAMIAIAMANDPALIIADEPTTALDVTIQAQILEVLQKAKEVTDAAVVLITHDLGVVAGNVDRVAVMYAGKLVENGPVDEVFRAPACRTRWVCCALCRICSPRGKSAWCRLRGGRRTSRVCRRGARSRRAAPQRSTSAAPRSRSSWRTWAMTVRWPATALRRSPAAS